MDSKFGSIRSDERLQRRHGQQASPESKICQAGTTSRKRVRQRRHRDRATDCHRAQARWTSQARRSVCGRGGAAESGPQRQHVQVRALPPLCAELIPLRLQATSKNAVTLRLEAAERRALQARFPAPLELESAPAPAPVNAPRENTPDREADEEEDRKERDAAWGQVYYSQEEGKSLRMCDWEGPETTAHDESDDEMEMLELDLGDWSGARADHQDLGSSKRLLDDAADRKPKRSNVRSTKPLASTRRLPSITISDSDDDVRAAGPSRST